MDWRKLGQVEGEVEARVVIPWRAGVALQRTSSGPAPDRARESNGRQVMQGNARQCQIYDDGAIDVEGKQ